MSEIEKFCYCCEGKSVVLKWNVGLELPPPARVPRCHTKSNILSVLSASLPARGRCTGKVRRVFCNWEVGVEYLEIMDGWGQRFYSWYICQIVEVRYSLFWGRITVVRDKIVVWLRRIISVDAEQIPVQLCTTVILKRNQDDNSIDLRSWEADNCSLVKNPVFYGTWNFIRMFIKPRRMYFHCN